MPLDKKSTYLPNKNVWLNKLYFQISNSQEKKCLTIDTRDVNKFEPGKLRTNANNGEEQMCYFNKNKSDTHFSSFLWQRSQVEPINFSIVKQTIEQLDSLRVNFNKIDRKALEMDDPRLKNNKIDYTSPMLQTQPMYESGNATDIKIKEENQDFSQQTEDKIVSRHKIRYTATRIKYFPTRIKSRNLLSNISYTGISKNDFCNETFILDVYVLLVKNLNPFSLRDGLYALERMYSARIL